MQNPVRVEKFEIFDELENLAPEQIKNLSLHQMDKSYYRFPLQNQQHHTHDSCPKYDELVATGTFLETRQIVLRLESKSSECTSQMHFPKMHYEVVPGETVFRKNLRFKQKSDEKLVKSIRLDVLGYIVQEVPQIFFDTLRKEYDMNSYQVPLHPFKRGCVGEYFYPGRETSWMPFCNYKSHITLKHHEVKEETYVVLLVDEYVGRVDYKNAQKYEKVPVCFSQHTYHTIRYDPSKSKSKLNKIKLRLPFNHPTYKLLFNMPVKRATLDMNIPVNCDGLKTEKIVVENTDHMDFSPSVLLKDRVKYGINLSRVDCALLTVELGVDVDCDVTFHVCAISGNMLRNGMTNHYV